ncbi:TPA: hypothetical protein HA231_00255 [Candidatus Woesearchaeota archaeon]|nr:hypothetical protein [Candidatus Woesearchaeota archaeon]
MNSRQEVREHIAKAKALMGLYATRANSEPKSQAALEHAQSEMKIIKQDIIAELQAMKGALRSLQRQ